MPGSSRAAVTLLLGVLSPILMGAAGQRDDFAARLLAAQNRVRAAVGVPPLQWDSQLALSARNWAQYLARTGKFEHSPDEPGAAPEGENLWAGTAGAYGPEAMVALWVSESRNYKPGVFPNNSRTGDIEDVGHYTQVIWARTKAVGCDLEHGRSEDVLVCRYKQAGNVFGQIPA
jgi:hypothetical protein